MTNEELHVIDLLISQDRSFSLYRLPGEEKIYFKMQWNGQPELLYDVVSLNGQTGFVIAPFRISPGHPIVIIHPDRSDIPSFTEVENSSIPEKNYPSCPVNNQKDNYADIFPAFMEPLGNQSLSKLVLSRREIVNRKEDFSPARTFYYACKRYIRSYVYLYHTPQTGTWLGSTPEILLSGQKEDWQTVALAGTQPLKNGVLPEDWDNKNREEQRLVAGYIKNQLDSLAIPTTEKGPFAVRAGELAHLKSEFHFHLDNTNRLGDILEILHPTPAVCGLPKEKAMQFILSHEGYNRAYYSGFIGWLDPDGKSDLYVNLRCMQIEAKFLTLYAGSGLLASSDIKEEWQETEDKLQTMRRLL